MDSLIDGLSSSANVVKALAVSAGGLIGVFATLAFFFVMIFVATRLAKKEAKTEVK